MGVLSTFECCHYKFISNRYIHILVHFIGDQFIIIIIMGHKNCVVQKQRDNRTFAANCCDAAAIFVEHKILFGRTS